MTKKGLKLVRIVLGILLFCGMIFSLVNIGRFLITEEKGTIEPFYKAKILYGNESCYLKNDNLYVINKSRGEIQIFDLSGIFRKGFQVPVGGGTLWTGGNDKLYAYSVRKDLLIEFCGAEVESEKSAYYNNPNEFYSSNNLIEEESLKIEKNEVSISDNKKIILEVSTNTLPVSISVVMLVLCFLSFLYITGIFSKLISKK